MRVVQAARFVPHAARCAGRGAATVRPLVLALPARGFATSLPSLKDASDAKDKDDSTPPAGASDHHHAPHYGELTSDGKPIGPDGQPITTFRGAWEAAKAEAHVRAADDVNAKLRQDEQRYHEASPAHAEVPKPEPVEAQTTSTGGAAPPPPPPASGDGKKAEEAKDGKEGKESKDSKDRGKPKTPLGQLAAGAKSGFWFLARFGGLLIPLSFFAVLSYKRRQKQIVHPDSWLFWNLHGNSVVEVKPDFNVGDLLGPVAGEMPQPIELFEAIRALNYAAADPRIVGLFADFSNIHNPGGMGGPGLGLAQMEELSAAIVRFKAAKKKQLGSEARVAIAWSDTFNTQTDYALAASFDEVYMQRSGNIPLTGLAGQVPFAQKLLSWFGIKMRTRARKDYKSMVSTFKQTDSLTPAQADNQAMVMGALSRTLCSVIGSSRWPELGHEGSADHVVELAQKGPFFGQEALDAGLVTDLKLKSDLLAELFGLDKKGELPPRPEDSDRSPVKWYERSRGAPAFMSVPTYALSNDRALRRRLSEDEQFKVGLVMANQSISSAAATHIILGLNEAADDEDVNAIVMRVDSPGGDVISSEDIWDAVRRVSAKKPVVASFGNTAASGGYYISTATDLVMAGQGTLTGSIGVASMSPQISRSFFDKVGVYIQSFFTGSTEFSAITDASPEFEKRMEKSMDEMYEDFIGKVAAGRGMTKEAVDTIAGGRVWTGLQAYLVANKDVEALWNAKTGVLVLNPDNEGDQMTTGAERIRLGDLLATYEATIHPGLQTGNPITVVARKDGESGVLAEVRNAALPSKDYGRGLVDAVGGIYDAAAVAWQMGLQREVAEKMAEGLSQAEAMASIRPKAPHSVVDGQLVLQGDLSVKKFPAEKGFLARLRAPDGGERPRLTGSPVGQSQSAVMAVAMDPSGAWEAAKSQLAAMMVRAAVRALASSAQEVSVTEVVRAANNPALLAAQPKMMYGGYDTLAYH